MIKCKHCEFKMDDSEAFYCNMNYGLPKPPEYLCIRCFNNDILSPTKKRMWEQYFKCDRCNNWFLNSSQMSGDNGDSVCQNCYNIEKYPPGIYKDAKAETMGATFKDNKDKTFMGVEIECFNNPKIECKDTEKFLGQPVFSNWTIGQDGSIGKGSKITCPIEAISPIMRGDDAFNSIKAVCAKLNERFKVDHTCGIHVHLDFSTEPIHNIINFCKVCYKFESQIMEMLPITRRNNPYCKPLTRKSSVENEQHPMEPFNLYNITTLESIEKKLYKCQDKDGLKSSKQNKYHSSRYFWLNLHTYFYRDRGTIEIRNHPGTLNSTKIINWIRIFLKLKQYSAETTKTKIEQLEGSFAELLKIIKDPDLVSYMVERKETFSVPASDDEDKYNIGTKEENTEGKQVYMNSPEASIFWDYNEGLEARRRTIR